MTLTNGQKQWLFDRMVMTHGLMAPADGEIDRKLAELESLGAVTCYDAMFGNNYYDLTPLGEKAIRPPRV